MARIARVIAPGLPHHITQRATNREPVFTTDHSRQVYLSLLREHSHRHQLRILAYCLMTNHIHLLAIPEHDDSLSRTLRYVHGRFAQYVNAGLNRCGHLWQNRFYSCPVDPAAADPVLAYIELNPVRAGIVAEADRFAWSSAGLHTGASPNRPSLLDMNWWASVGWNSQSWKEYLLKWRGEESTIRLATFTGRPLGSDDFVRDLEARLGRTLERQKPGPKRPLQVAAGQTGLF